MNPKLKFKIDYKKDVQTFFDFNNEADYDNGRVLEWAFFKKFPFLKKYKDGNKLNIGKNEVTDFVKSFYDKEQIMMEKHLSVYQSNWENKEKSFLNLVNEIFCDNFWPEGKYVVYLTIWGIFPRFLEDSTFQVPYKYKNQKYINVIIAHEMLHFVFHNYFYQKYPQYKQNEHNFFVWHISEIFNVIVQNSSKWLKIFEVKTMDYPEHREIIGILKSKYNVKDVWKVDDLIENIAELVKDSNLA